LLRQTAKPVRARKPSAKKLAKLQNKSDIVNFAERIGIHPAIVVGRLQHDRLRAWGMR
jgi:hypothetical protein